MKAQRQLRRLTQLLKQLDKHIKVKKKYGCPKTQRYRFNLQTKIIRATMRAQDERRKHRDNRNI